MNTLKLFTMTLFCIMSAACTSVVNNMLEALDGGPNVDAASICASQADGTECDDGDFCNGADACLSGVCVPGRNPAADGQGCRAGDTTQICVDGSCQASACGDGVVSVENGEECDAADGMNFGCTAACQFICEPDNDTCDSEESSCDDGLVCNEDFRCELPLEVTNPEGTTCETPDEIPGTCRNGVCCPTEGC